MHRPMSRITAALCLTAAVAFAAYNFPTNPAALGIVTVVTAGSPVSLLSSVPAAQGQDFKCRAIELEAIKDVAKADNTGLVYLGESGMNTSTGAGVIKSLLPGEQWSVSGFTNALRPERLYLDADTNGDGAQVRCVVQ